MSIVTPSPDECEAKVKDESLLIVLTLLSVILTMWISYKLLQRYAHPNTMWYYKISVWISWVLGFVGIFLLPLDICITLATGCDSPPGVVAAWEFVYWTTFIMAWIIDPGLQAFHNDGSYLWQTRLKKAIKENVMFYVIALGIVIGVVIFLAICCIDLNNINLPDIVIGIANAYGMLLIILMLGYGMIAVPRDLWYLSDTPSQLERCYFLAPPAHAAAQDAEYDLRILISAVENAAERGKNAADADVHTFLETVVRHIPLGMTGNDMSQENLMDIDMESISKLHTKLFAASARFENRAGEWERILVEIEFLKVVINGVMPLQPGEATCWNRTYWSWRLHHADKTFKGVSIFCMVMTGVMMWGEIGVPLPPDWPISIWGEIIRATSGGFGTFLFGFISLAYMSTCTFISLFQLNWFEAQRLTKKRTDASGLLFNAYYACRLQFSIGFNYLLTLKWRTDKQSMIDPNDPSRPRVPLTGFQSIVKGMQGEEGGIMYWFLQIMPLIVALFAVITFFNVHAYLFKLMDIDVYSRPILGNSEHQERITEGKSLIDRETRRGRSASGRVVNESMAAGGIRSRGYQAPRNSVVYGGSPLVSERGGSLESGKSNTSDDTVGSGGSNGRKKKKKKRKKNNSKEQNLLGSEDQNDSLLGGDSLTNGDDGSDFGEQPGFVGAGTRAIMGGSEGGDKKKKKKKKKKDKGIEFGQDE